MDYKSSSAGMQVMNANNHTRIPLMKRCIYEPMLGRNASITKVKSIVLAQTLILSLSDHPVAYPTIKSRCFVNSSNGTLKAQMPSLHAAHLP